MAAIAKDQISKVLETIRIQREALHKDKEAKERLAQFKYDKEKMEATLRREAEEAKQKAFIEAELAKKRAIREAKKAEAKAKVEAQKKKEQEREAKKKAHAKAEYDAWLEKEKSRDVHIHDNRPKQRPVGVRGQVDSHTDGR
jgi:hypothetical protein